MKALKGKESQELKSIKGLFLKEMTADEIKNEVDEIKKWENKVKQKDLRYETNKYVYDFQKFETIRSFGDNI